MFRGHDAIEYILSTRKMGCANGCMEWPFLPPLEWPSPLARRRIPSRRTRKGAGMLGSPTGHPFFIVDGDQTKAPRWHRLSMQVDGARQAYQDRRKVEWTPYGGPVPTPRGLLLDRSGAGSRRCIRSMAMRWLVASELQTSADRDFRVQNQGSCGSDRGKVGQAQVLGAHEDGAGRFLHYYAVVVDRGWDGQETCRDMAEFFRR
jgi:hypothetical protein